MGRGLEDDEISGQFIVELQNGGDISTAITIVWCGPDRQDRLVKVPLVSFHHQLMGPTDQLNVVVLVEFLRHVRAEQVAGPARTDAPSVAGVLRVRPQEITHRAVVRHFLFPVDHADLVEGLDGGGEAAVDAEDFAINQGGQAEVVEDFCAVPVKEKGEV